MCHFIHTSTTPMHHANAQHRSRNRHVYVHTDRFIIIATTLDLAWLAFITQHTTAVFIHNTVHTTKHSTVRVTNSM